MGRTQVSALQRLQALPAIFTGPQLTIRYQWTSKQASHYLWLWRQRGLVEAFGGHSDVYANLLVDPRPDWSQALLMAMPSAVVVGVEALRQAGWITQVPTRPAVAIRSTQQLYDNPHFDIERRPASWFEATRTAREPSLSSTLPVLSPAWALADMLNRSSWAECGLTPDDIDWDAPTDEDRVQWALACSALKVSADSLQQVAVESH